MQAEFSKGDLARPDGIGHPLAASGHNESMNHPPRRSQSLSTGFKMYWGLFGAGFRVGLCWFKVSAGFPHGSL